VLIDWITVAAQIVNFLVLVVLLKIFLYDRIVEAMDKREQRISDRLSEAEAKRREAEQEKREFQKKKRELAEERKEVMDEAERKAEKRREELVQKARAEVDEMARGWRRSLERDKEDLVRELSRMTADQAVRIAGRAVSDLAGGDLRESAAEVFLEKLKQLDENDRRALAEGAAEEGRIEVLCDGEPPGELKARITRAVHEHVVGDVEVKYEPDSVRLGFALRSRGRRFDWSLDGYLEEYREKVGGILAGEISGTAEERPSGSEGEAVARQHEKSGETA
jgi:F-type H+-transporting ATPase subunit b